MTCRPNCFAQNLEHYDFSLSSAGSAIPCNDSLCADDNEYEKQLCAGGHGGTCTVQANLRRILHRGGAAQRGVHFRFDQCQHRLRLHQRNEQLRANGNGARRRVRPHRPGILIIQLGATQFSYCLTDSLSDNANSRTLFIGPSAGLSGGTPVTYVPYENLIVPFSSFYYLLVAGMSVGKAWLNIPLRHVIIDSSLPFLSLVAVA
uniref:Xylanase inhibitor N-terminal domain-containing protein n=1 Tax=Triticum urartu TaxID=4572 RepID=A0A8R7QVJ1_TRIUA